MDNCYAHLNAEILNASKNVQCLFLLLSIIQPMDQEIINSLKYQQKTNFLRKLLHFLNHLKIFLKQGINSVSKNSLNTFQKVLLILIHHMWNKLWLFSIFWGNDEELNGF